MHNGGYQGGHRNRQQWQNPLHVDTGAYYQQRNNRFPNEVDPGMNGDGWQGPGGRGGGHHMNGGGGGGGRRGGGGGGNMHNQNRMPNQHHGNRMMPPGFRHQQPQTQYMPQYPPMAGMPPGGDMMDINMRMGDMSLGNGGQYADMGMGQVPPMPPAQQQQGGWNQPAPFAQQDDLYEPMPFGNGGGGNMPPHHVPFGQRGGGNQYGQRMQSNRGYRGGHQNNGGYMQPMMQPPMMGHGGGQQQNGGGGGQFYNQQQQPSFAPSPFSMSSQMGGGPEMGGQGGPNGFQITTSSMDDYSMWTDENDEDAKRKKILRDKGLLQWGDADVSNAKPIRKWLVPEGEEEDIEVALARCPSHLKKKTLNEEALRRRLASDNPQVVAQAQQQQAEEMNATLKVGKRPIVACGWGDLPSEYGDKSDYDQGSSKGWDESSLKSQNLPMMHQNQHDDGISPWNMPNVGGGGPSSSETRNPFFAHHMQQQHQQQMHHQGGYVDNGDSSVWTNSMDPNSGMLPVGGGGPMTSSASAASVPLGMLSMASVAAQMGGVAGSDEHPGGQKKLADSLKLAVEKGHLDISLLSLPHIPGNVLDLLTEILAVIPRLDGYEEELKKLGDNRPSNISEKDDVESWMDKAQKNEHDKLVIGTVTSKIEVTQLSKKITEALVEAGLLPAPQNFAPGAPNNHHHHHNHRGPPPPGGGAGPSTSRGPNGQGPSDHYYDYSFLG